MSGAVETYAAGNVLGLELPDGLDFDGWLEVGATLRDMDRKLPWMIGDWLNYGERKYGEKYSQALETTGLEYQTLNGMKWAASRFEIMRRRTNLSWSHHREVAALPPVEQDHWLDEAETEKLSKAELRRRIKQRKNAIGATPSNDTCTVADLETLVAGGYKFGTIYADPPWIYGNQATRAATGNHYDGMTVDEICDLPVADLTPDAAHLHLWTTNAFLFDARRIIEAWGFEYKSCFVWVKSQMGIGNYWRVSHELMLLGVKGAQPFEDRGLMSWREIARGKHSAKPDQVRADIEKASPGPRLELFGRRVSPGWTVWGNEIERTMFDQSVKEIAA
jgi:N6-adenosine-specific RNA methylase IME4